MERTTPKIIIVTGPESTGKTTIARSIAVNYNVSLVPEYAREYIEGLGRNYNYNDILHIAKFQHGQYNACLTENKNCIIDTYLIITKIWFLWHSGNYPNWLDNAIAQTKGAMYLLCSPDIEWVPDKVRENGGEARNMLFETYRNELIKFGLNYCIVSGQGAERDYNAGFFAEKYLNGQ
ncbi:MAG: ATP-binding protein [Bacteroidales bacterium]|nr:ATP-binding protein [Bacteroidales bacterium]